MSKVARVITKIPILRPFLEAISVESVILCQVGRVQEYF